MAEKLWELESLTTDAIDFVKRALDMTSTFLTDHHSGEPLPWHEMGAAQNHLVKALEALEVAMVPLRPAIEVERAHDDHMADLADGQSY